MPRNLSAWKDLVIHLAVMLVLVIALSQYARYLAAAAFLLWIALVAFAIERCTYRRNKFREYCETVIGGGNEMMRYATLNIPQAMMVINENGRLEWCNDITKNYADEVPEQGMEVNEFWKGILKDEVLEPLPENEKNQPKIGSYVAKVISHDKDDNGEEITMTRYFKVRYRQMAIKAEYPPLIALFAQEVTNYENLKLEYKQSRTVLMYVQVDNYD